VTPVATAKPLSGRVVVVTRPRAQAQAFAGLLEADGASVLVVPTIAIEPPASWGPLDRALERLGDYKWAVFTSVNGVEMTRRRLGDAGRGMDVFRGLRLAAIGPATAEALGALGLNVEVVPEEYVAEGLAARLRALIQPGDRVLLARASVARDVLVSQLEAAGARVDEVPAYRTLPAAEDTGPLRSALAQGKVDVVTFTSSSAVRHFRARTSRGCSGRRPWPASAPSRAPRRESSGSRHTSFQRSTLFQRWPAPSPVTMVHDPPARMRQADLPGVPLPGVPLRMEV
jgi:uroporphyrinogen III methyltransferase/synthase